MADKLRIETPDGGTRPLRILWVVSRLDLDGMLQLDVQLPGRWLLRAEAMAFYDFVYRIKGRSRYSDAVIDETI